MQNETEITTITKCKRLVLDRFIWKVNPVVSVSCFYVKMYLTDS